MRRKVDQNSDRNAPAPPLPPSCRPRSQLTIFTPDTVVGEGQEGLLCMAARKCDE